MKCLGCLEVSEHADLTQSKMQHAYFVLLLHLPELSHMVDQLEFCVSDECYRQRQQLGVVVVWAVSISSAHTRAPLSYWTSLTKTQVQR